MKTKGFVVLVGIILFVISCKDKKEDPAPSKHTYGLPEDNPPDTSAVSPDTTLPVSTIQPTYIIAGDTTGLSFNTNHYNHLLLTGPSAAGISYSLNMDNNASTDLLFNVFHGVALGLQMHYLGSGTQSGANYVVEPELMDSGDTIFFDDPWQPTCSFAGQSWCDVPNTCQPSSSGYYNGASNKYVGCMFLNASDTVYGWVRVDIAGTTDITIRNFAYLVK